MSKPIGPFSGRMSKQDAEPDMYPQDVDDPIWHESEPGFAVEDTAVRTHHGLLDLVHAVKEDVNDWIDRELEDSAPNRRWPPGKPKQRPVNVHDVGSDNWVGRTEILVAGNPTHLVVRRPDRSKVIIRNLGAAVVLISASTIDVQVGPPRNTIRLEPQSTAANPTSRDVIEFHHKGDIWAWCSASVSLEIQDEYGDPEDVYY